MEVSGGTSSSSDTTASLPLLASALASNPSSLSLHYLAEGNANVIYTLHPFPFSTSSSLSNPPNLDLERECKSAVLRLRKNLPFTKPCIEVLSAFRTRIMPLFEGVYGEVLLEQVLVKLSPEIVREVNEMLRAMESDDGNSRDENVRGKVRPVGRRGAYHPSFDEEAHGIVMPNLLHLHPAEEECETRLLEFKPKWLVQSPSAPEEARRCRTCAVNLARRLEGRHKGRGDSGFCPFALLSDDEIVLRNALEKMDPRGGRLKEEFVRKVQPALRHLQSLQRKYGEVGLEDYRSPEQKDFAVAMALRDCSVFLIVSDAEILDVKLADLDLKTTEGGKVKKWAEIEEELISKGMYCETDGDGGHLCLWQKEVG